MKIFIKNPCKYCITRPACKNICKDYKKYQDRLETTIGSFILFIVVALVIWFSYNLWGFKITTAKYIVISSWFLCYYFAIKKLIQEDCGSFNDLKNYEQALVIILSPWGEATIWIIEFLNLDEPLEKFCYRYIKHNHPSTKEKSEGYTRKAH
jgi:hypothetical protein